MTKVILVDTEKSITQDEEKLFVNYDFFYNINNLSYKVEVTQKLVLSDFFEYLKNAVDLRVLALKMTNKYIRVNSIEKKEYEEKIKKEVEREKQENELREKIQNIEKETIEKQRVKITEENLKIKLSVLTEKTGWVVIREKSFDKDSKYPLKEAFDFNFDEKISQMKDLMVSNLYSSIPEKEEELILQRSLSFLKKFVPLKEKAIMS